MRVAGIWWYTAMLRVNDKVMREIKFRAWCDYHKVMIPDYCVAVDNLFQGYDLTNNTHGITSVMQFIGLHDKKGKKIYEGDCFSEDDTILVVVWNTDKAKFQIDMYGHQMYRNEGGGEEFSSEISKIDEDVFDIDCLTDDEIIGNIHSNPELITALNGKEANNDR